MKSIQKQSKKVLWNDISQFQSSLFNVFLKYEKDIWPQKAWSAMDKAGLNEYITFMDKQRVLLRFMTIATLYNEFCDLAFDIYFDRIGQTFEWIQQGVINRLQLWEFIQFNYDIDINDYDDLNMCLIKITCDIIDNLRYEVSEALIAYYKYGEIDLFLDMLSTGYDLTETEFEEWDKMNAVDLDENEERAFYWIAIGMPRSPRESVKF
ncbi:MAG: hypothetical protein PHP51_08165 [Desulfotomaculaceae bacterium]|nr:hypothetical protein [Desulfotomaculaceae bacterium]MDD4768089.1 hypothetical protein [Desulfotomaculaceae bacterium]